MSLTENPDIVTWPETHYVFVEKDGPFAETAPAAWHELVAQAPALEQQGKVTARFALYRMGPDRMTYRAGVAMRSRPDSVPPGTGYTLFKGGKYARFVLTGPYRELGPASARVWELVVEHRLKLRPDFAIEHYVNDPMKIPEDQLITEILVPIK
jgi:effector-binding domain-containing protein